MSEEIFDVVNERDEVIDRQPRREVHRLGLKHRAVHVLVFNSRGEVFLQKRSPKKDTAAGLWDSSASGHLDSGEDYDACASCAKKLGWLWHKHRSGCSELKRARKQAGNFAGFIAANRKVRFNCTPTRLRVAGGSRRKKSHAGPRRNREISRAHSG